MLETTEVALNIVLPDEIGLVMMQPSIALDAESEPFVWIEDRRAEQLVAILRTLEIAQQSGSGKVGAHFTIFPEYSIPGLRGVAAIESVLHKKSWQNNSVIIGGLDGLTREEYGKLCHTQDTHVHEKNRPEAVEETQWVNCSITWAKEADGTVRRWVQPKLSPSWPEEAITAKDMFSGRASFVFTAKFQNTTDCRFMSLICFDWVGSEAGPNLLWELLQEVDNASKPNRKEMNLMFVLQHNPKPNHHSFLENTRRYFEEQTLFPFTVRIQGAVVFANTAGGDKPGYYPSYGFSSVIFSPSAPFDCKACPPSAAVVTKKLRGCESLGTCKESLLREMGACVHSIRLRLPQFINLGSSDRSLPIKSADVYPVELGTEDARTPAGPVPAAVKWVNDQIDTLPNLLVNESSHNLKATIEESHREVCQVLRRQPESVLLKCIDLSTGLVTKDRWLSIQGRPVHLVDNWDNTEVELLTTVIQTLSVIHSCRALDIQNSLGHAVLISGDQVCDVAIVRGKTHQEALQYANKKLRTSGQRIRIIITQDGSDTMLGVRDRSITTAPEPDFTKGPNITDPDSSSRHAGHQNITSACYNSLTIPELEQQIATLLKL